MMLSDWLIVYIILTVIGRGLPVPWGLLPGPWVSRIAPRHWCCSRAASQTPSPHRNWRTTQVFPCLHPHSPHYAGMSALTPAKNKSDNVNPLALRLSLESIVCFSHIFENNFWTKRKFKKNLRGSCCLPSDKHFSFKWFQENAFVSKIYSKTSGPFWPFWALMG